MIFVTQEIKQDPEKRWALPDEVFFAAGACHILAFAFLEKYPDLEFQAKWIKPLNGHRGNHIFVTNNELAFDYNGFTTIDNFIENTEGQMRSIFYNWNYELINLPKRVLVSEKESKTYDGLWLREPGQFLHDALPRAEKYLEKFNLPDEMSLK